MYSTEDVPVRWMLIAIIMLLLTISSATGLLISTQTKSIHMRQILINSQQRRPTSLARNRRLTLFAIVKPKNNNNNNNNEKKQVYKLDGGGGSSFTVLGSRSAKRRLLNATHRLAKDLAELAQQHKEIERRIAVLQKPGHISEEAELKRLKRQKLAVADISRALRSISRREEASSTNKIVGAGGFCDVLIGHQVISKEDANHVELERGEPVAVKVSRSSEDAFLLLEEARKIQSLQAYKGFIRVKHIQPHLDDDDNAAVVLDLLGPSLEDLWWGCTCGAGGFSVFTTLKIAKQLLSRLETLVKEGIAHRDLQPANILMGRVGEKSRKTLHLIDFGIATTIGHSSPRDTNLKHIFSGTPRFASVSALRNHGGGATAADDLESICYTLAFLLKGEMPWSEESEANAKTQEGAHHLASLKSATNPLCKGNGPADRAINSLLEHARECQKKGTAPDYLNSCLATVENALLEESSIKSDLFSSSKYDWDQQNLKWSNETGILHHSLYSDVDGDW